MATVGNRTTGETVRLDDLVKQIDEWVESDSQTRKVLARKRANGIMRREEQLMMQAARMVQDHGLISIITKHKDGIISFVAEKVAL